jgi:taurine dioxygenase
MTWDVVELQPRLGFGCIVTGLSDDDLDDEGVRAVLRRLWILHGLIIFRGSRATPGFQVRLGGCFGTLERHNSASLHVDGHPELIWLNANGEHQPVYQVAGEPVVGWFPWHSDTIWRAEVLRGGLLGAATLPARGGDTGFQCRIRAYDRLPADLKREIAGIEIVYKLSENIADHPYTLSNDVVRIANPPVHEEMGRLMAAMAPPVAHALVVRQNETGRDYLNFSPMGARHVVGLSDAAAHVLLTRLAQHVCDDSGYRHRWQPDDILLWDNWRMNHRAYGTPVGEERALTRATIGSPLCQGRVLEQAGAEQILV